MGRVRRAAAAALVVAWVMGLTSVGLGAGVPSPAGIEAAAAVSWPPSALVLSEVVTGAASASDEFVEIANQTGTAVDLIGLEVVYVTASGSTVTRKSQWTESRALGAGQRILLANASGAYAAFADSLYSGGFAATGGALVLRPLGGAPLDAVGWGDATNAFVEGNAAPPPPAGSSIERRPGGTQGNGTDTNDNLADWFVQPSPSPQNLSAPPVPAPVPTADTTPSAAPTATPSEAPPPSGGPTPTGHPTGSPEPTAPSTPTPTSDPVTPAPTVAPTTAPTATPTSTPIASPGPTAAATPTVTPPPTPVPTAAPSPTPAPTATPAPTSTPSPSPTASASLSPADPIAVVRSLPDGASATIAGTLTTRLGALEDGRTAFVQDATAGIAIYLDAAAPHAWPAGTTIRATGVVGSRFALRTLRVSIADLVATGTAPLPEAVGVATGSVGESTEGRRVAIGGTTVGSPSTLADGTGLWVDDGSGQIRLIVSAEALGGQPVPGGTRVEARGPVGQRDSTGTGTAGYRVHAIEPGDFIVVPPPTPTPSPAPTATVAPTGSPGATPPPTPTPPPSGAPTAAPTTGPTPAPSGAQTVDIGTVRTWPIGSLASVSGVVTAEAGRIGSPALITIEDDTGGIVVKLPDAAPRPARGTRLTVSGHLRDPYGQLELRPDNLASIRIGSAEPLPAPMAVGGAAFGEGIEGRLVVIEGVVRGRPQRSATGDLTIAVTADDGNAVRVMADSSSGIVREAFVDGARYRLTGVVGQRASAKGRLDGYRLWLRDPGDVGPLSTGSPAGPGTPTDAPAAGAVDPTEAPAMTIARALLVRDGTVRVEGVVTTGASLLDTSGRRIVIEDESAAVEVLLPAGGTPPEAGMRVVVTGTLGRAYGAPRLRATAVQVQGGGPGRQPIVLRGAPGPAHEWRLVRLSGTLVELRRLGSRWRAELDVGGERIPIAGLTGAGIPASSLVAGRRATITGIVKRAHPSATDRRFSVVPRTPADVSVGPAEPGAATGATGGGAAGQGGGLPGAPGRGTSAAASPGPRDADLADLEARLGEVVRVGGLVVELHADGFEIDDGTALGRIVLVGEAAEYLPLIDPGDAINATGRVERREGAIVVVVSDPAGIARVGDLLPVAIEEEPSMAPLDRPEPDVGPSRAADLGGPFGLGATGTAGLASLLLISIASTAVTLLRRQRTRRALLARVAARVALVAGPTPAMPGDRPPGRRPEGHG